MSIQEDLCDESHWFQHRNSLSLTSTGAICVTTGGSLDVTNNATLTGVGIALADRATDALTIGGTADLEGRQRR
ncbi:MAG: hypothetical protein U0872_13470 [Planctomycetaceae bacterium]